MSRKKSKQKRVGVYQKRQIKKFCDAIKDFHFRWAWRNEGENELNKRLLSTLLQDFEVVNKSIPTAKFVGEEFRPEFYLKIGSKPVCAVECKVLNKKSSKPRWKQGLSQALLYSQFYKTVVLLYFDFTNGSRYFNAFGRGNTSANSLAKRLREQNKIYLIVVKPIDH